MSAPISLPIRAAQVDAIIDDVRREIVAHLIKRKGDEFDFYQAAQIAGILNVSTQTLAKLPIPKYPLAGRMIFYRLSEVGEYLKSNREK